MYIAGIGTRTPSPEMRARCRGLGEFVVRKNHTLKTGNALGCDYAFAEGANCIDPKQVILMQPWKGYNQEQIQIKNKVYEPPYPPEFEQLIKKLHEAPEKLSRGALALHTRNVAIIKKCVLVLAAPSTDKPWGGGTGMGIKLAKHFKIPVLDLNKVPNKEIIQILNSL